MSPAHKQRIVGAIVLVALGLIIVPTVLDFSRDERTDTKGMEIPPGPDAMQMEVLPLDDWSQKSDPGVTRQEPEFEGEAPDAVVDPVGSPEPAPAEIVGDAEGVESPSQTPASSSPIATVPEVKTEPPVVAAPAPALAPKPKVEAATGGGKWVVQVASLAAEAKAISLRDQLRKAGYPALVEQAKSKGDTLYRVKAGPVQSRAEADDLKKRIKQSIKLDGFVTQAQ